MISRYCDIICKINILFYTDRKASYVKKCTFYRFLFLLRNITSYPARRFLCKGIVMAARMSDSKKTCLGVYFREKSAVSLQPSSVSGSVR